MVFHLLRKIRFRPRYFKGGHVGQCIAQIAVGSTSECLVEGIEGKQPCVACAFVHKLCGLVVGKVKERRLVFAKLAGVKAKDLSLLQHCFGFFKGKHFCPCDGGIGLIILNESNADVGQQLVADKVALPVWVVVKGKANVIGSRGVGVGIGGVCLAVIEINVQIAYPVLALTVITAYDLGVAKIYTECLTKPKAEVVELQVPRRFGSDLPRSAACQSKICAGDRQR